ncbi:MAG: sialate O-acetylesterase [Verrucomicrobiota bacterium JB025]|nr:sialate O-acetylesterase [Verrucomicrobiota bacterium JB025]
MKFITKTILTGVVALANPLFASLEVASVFTDHMVLQRDLPVPVWGRADANERVAVAIAGQQQVAVAGADGRWSLSLDPLAGSFEPTTMTVSAGGGDEVVLEDVLVGEVWICSGQSNMQMAVNAVPEMKELAAGAKGNGKEKGKGIRCFEVERSVAFEEQERCGGKWVDGPPNSAVAFGFAHFLQQDAKVPVGIILTCWGSSGIEAWMPRDMVETVPHFKTLMEDFDKDRETRDKIQAILDGPRPWKGKDDVFLRRQINVLYNAMMAPLAPVAARGMVWYQGERNTQSMHGMVDQPWFARNSGMLKYADTLKEWIKRYRKAWGRDDFEVLVVMLPGYGKTLPGGPKGGPESPVAHSWAWLRESQLKALELPHVAVANTIDLGDVKNVHPKDKLPVARRLALLAARDTLGVMVEAEGPVMEQVEARGNALRVRFEHADGLKTSDGEPPSGFWIAEDTDHWVPADAEIRGEAVVLKAAEMAAPRYVRYAFAGKPKVNLVNGAGLPAVPFRNDPFVPAN